MRAQSWAHSRPLTPSALHTSEGPVTMPFVTVDCQTSASGQVNEDRAGAVNDLAWVIDGATDVVETPLTRALSDADWIAGRLDAALS